MQLAAEVNSKPAQTAKGEAPKPACFQRQAPLSDSRTTYTWGSAIHLISYTNALLGTQLRYAVNSPQKRCELKKIRRKLSTALSAVRNPGSEDKRQEIASTLEILAAVREAPRQRISPIRAEFGNYMQGATRKARELLCKIEPEYAAASGYMQTGPTVPGSHSKQRKPTAKENAWAITRLPGKGFRNEPLCGQCTEFTWGSAIKLIAHTNVIVHEVIGYTSYPIKTQEEHLQLSKKLEVAMVLAQDSQPAKAKQEIYNALKKITGFKMMRILWGQRHANHGDYMKGARDKSRQLLQLIDTSNYFPQ